MSLGHISSTISVVSLVSQRRKLSTSRIKTNRLDSLGLYVKPLLPLSDVKKSEIGQYILFKIRIQNIMKIPTVRAELR